MNNWRLRLAPDKCSYIIFSLYRKAGENGKMGIKRETLDLILCGKHIKIYNSPTFLGMRFDKCLEKCHERLNLIKVLSHQSWKINQETLIQIYKSLMANITIHTIIYNSHYN